MIYQQLFFINNRLFDRSTIKCPVRPHSLAYFCTTCGEIWGRIVIEAPGHKAHWSLEHVPCRAHLPSGVPDWGMIPGSFLSPCWPSRKQLAAMWWGRAIEHLPPKVIAWEFQRQFDYYEAQQDDNSSSDNNSTNSP